MTAAKTGKPKERSMGMDREMDAFEDLASKTYERFKPLADSYYYKFRRPSVTGSGAPCMVFLGNHSSGKSTLINWLLGGDPVQDVGLAPTDDEFTVIMYGDSEEDVCGPAALARLPEEFAGLKLFGGNFFQRLRLKVRRRDLLKSVTLIDSPGMIDSAAGTVDRSYDFEGVVRQLAELCDMVFFLLDPDKPGTTGETVNMFAKCLVGVEFKLRVLLNKCDAFSSMYDFARTYGTVCWNLSRVLRTKDLPKIWTLYSGDTRQTTEGGLDLADFNRHRDEFLGVVRAAAARRRDNLFSQALSDFMGLSLRACVVNHVWRRLCLYRFAVALSCSLASIGLGLVVWLASMVKFGSGSRLAATFGIVAALLGFAVSFFVVRFAERMRRQRLAGKVDEIFAAEYSRSIAIGSNDNLRLVWDETRAETADVVRSAPLRLPLFGEMCRRRLEKAAKKLFAAFRG